MRFFSFDYIGVTPLLFCPLAVMLICHFQPLVAHIPNIAGLYLRIPMKIAVIHLSNYLQKIGCLVIRFRAIAGSNTHLYGTGRVLSKSRITHDVSVHPLSFTAIFINRIKMIRSYALDAVVKENHHI